MREVSVKALGPTADLYETLYIQIAIKSDGNAFWCKNAYPKDNVKFLYVKCSEPTCGLASDKLLIPVKAVKRWPMVQVILTSIVPRIVHSAFGCISKLFST